MPFANVVARDETPSVPIDGNFAVLGDFNFRWINSFAMKNAANSSSQGGVGEDVPQPATKLTKGMTVKNFIKHS